MRKVIRRRGMKAGITGEARLIVTENNTAETMKSGTLPVLATPAVAALMEQASQESVTPELAENETTVGISLNMKHIKATGLGKEVYAKSVLTEVDGRRLVFEATAYEGETMIASAVHERFVVDAVRFLEKIN